MIPTASISGMTIGTTRMIAEVPPGTQRSTSGGGEGDGPSAAHAGLLGEEGDRVTEMKYDKLRLSRALLDTEESEAAVKGVK